MIYRSESWSYRRNRGDRKRTINSDKSLPNMPMPSTNGCRRPGTEDLHALLTVLCSLE